MAEIEIATETETEELLAEPSTELAERATRELGWTERLSISRMSPSTGTENVDVYNLEHAALHLFGTSWDSLLVDGSKAGMAYVGTADFVAWLDGVIGDKDLADAVAQRFADAGSYVEQIQAIQPLLRERMSQYEAVMS